MKPLVIALCLVSAVSAHGSSFCTGVLLPWRISLSRPLPIVRQDINGKCGPSSLAIALAYLRKIPQPDPLNPVAACDFMTSAVFQVGRQLTGLAQRATPTELEVGIALNMAESLATTARLFGASAIVAQGSMLDMAQWIGREEVVLVHWWSGPGPLDFHWSAVQEINGANIILRDPWPTNPWHHVKPLTDFAMRSSLGIPGLFITVRVSDHPQ